MPPQVPTGFVPDPVVPEGFEPDTPVFKGTNETDAQGNPVVRGIQSAWDVATTPLIPQIGTGARAAADVMDRPQLRDQAYNDMLPGLGTARAMGRGAVAGMVEGAGNVLESFTSPLGIALWLAGQGETSALAKYLPAIKPYLNATEVKAIQRAVQGVAGTGMTVEGGHTVLNAKDLGDIGRGVTQMAAGGAGVLSAAVPRSSATVPRPRLTPQEQASNAFAAQEGIPLDAATATGSKFLRAVQKRVANSMGGEGTASDLIARQQEGLAAVGQRQAERVSPQATTPEQAGQAVEGSLTDTISREHQAGGVQYRALRGLEADPVNAAEVPAPRASQKETAAITERMRSSLGYVPTPAELSELRRMATEMDEWRFTKRTWNDISDQPGKRGNAAGGDAEIVAGQGGAPVYDDILKSLRSTDYVPTRAHVQRMLEESITTGRFNEVSKAAFDVAQRRLANDPAVSKPFLPPSAGDVPERPPIRMGMPVSVAPVQDAMRPIYERLMAEAQVAPLMGSKAEAARILARLMDAPEFVPVSIADSVLGELKTVARADDPNLRSVGQGIAAQAVTSLSAQIDEIVSQVPGATAMLREGRTATKNKYAAADVLDNLRADPVGMYKSLTAPNNSGLHLLRAVAKQAPEVLPQIGRAKLDEWLNLATESGRFGHADRLYAEWRKMGQETKALLLKEPGHVAALDDFFLLAKRLGENPNPSGTAHVNNVFNVLSQVISYPVAKLLYTERGVKALTAVLKLNPSMTSRTAAGAASEAAWARLAIVAQQAGADQPEQKER